MAGNREEGSRTICTNAYCSFPWAASRGWLRDALSQPAAFSSLKVGHQYLTYHVFPLYVLYYSCTVLWFVCRVFVVFVLFCFCGWVKSLDRGHEHSQKVIKHCCWRTHLKMKEHFSKFKMQTKGLCRKTLTFV